MAHVCSPKSAEKTDNALVVTFVVGFWTMEFNVDAQTGKILDYKKLEKASELAWVV